ncbi:hypothetical protein G6030_04085 [Dietzia sp. E1]|uniref:hypothetical protein n=1 Tax=Dietzia sp. E1 TaxID=328361 RepID=UPI0015FBB5A1|nr:hypothetical protein [Dietzia sp. E1]MBB1020474.1 hypothetical protein [Dietzia sp. E1]
MSSRVTSRVTARVLAAGVAALAAIAALATAAPSSGADPLPYTPGWGFELAPGQVTVPESPAFWSYGDSFRLLSPYGATSPVHCASDGGYPFGRCWQFSPDGAFVELRRDTRVSDFWRATFTRTGSTTSAYIGLYELAQRMGWLGTSGGIFIPPIAPGSDEGTYSTMMPLARESTYPVFDVWVYPGFVPGS